MSRRRGFVKAELVSGIALVMLGAATIVQLLSIQARSTNDDAVTPPLPPAADAKLLVTELRRIETHGLLSASSHEIVLRVPAAVGVVCASGPHTTTLAVLPAFDAALAHGAAGGLGWQTTGGDFTFRDASLRVETAPENACDRAAIAPPAGSLIVAISPAIADAPVGGAAVVFERVAYELRPSIGTPRRASLWRTAGASEQLLATLAADAAFRFYVDAAPSATSAAPSPVSRVRGIELHMRAADTRAGSTLAALPTAVFFRSTAG